MFLGCVGLIFATNQMDGWIKLHRKLLDKPIWNCSTMEQKVILITILMMANHEENEWEWKGEKYVCLPGQFITSLEKIAKMAGKDISIQNVRTALLRFENYEFLTNESTNKNRLITICNWEQYQEKNNKANKQTNRQLTSNQQAANRQLTTNKNDKECKNIIVESSNEDSLSAALQADVSELIDYKKFVDWFNSETKGVFGMVKYPVGEKRKASIRARVRENGKQSLFDAVKKAYESDFLKGNNQRGFIATFDWIIRPSNFDKILSDNYKNHVNGTNQGNNTASSQRTSPEQLMDAIASGIARAKYDKAKREGGIVD